MNEWINTQMELPPVQEGLISLSEDVEVKLEDGTVKKGFYNYRIARWHIGEKYPFKYGHVTYWRPLKEAIDE